MNDYKCVDCSKAFETDNETEHCPRCGSFNVHDLNYDEDEYFYKEPEYFLGEEGWSDETY